MFRLKNSKITHILMISTAGIFVLLTALTVALVWQSMRQQSLVEAEAKAKILLDRNLATHSYFSHILKPRLFKWIEPYRSKEYFDPSWMSSTYAIRQIHKYFNEINAEGYYIKDAAINARSDENEANDFEKLFLQRLKRDNTLESYSGVHTIGGKPYLAVIRKGEVLERACLRCHSDPSVAPGELVSLYGAERSFQRQVGEQISAISMQIPLSSAYAHGNRAAVNLSIMLTICIAIFFGAKMFLYRHYLVSPLRVIRDRALAIAGGSERLGEAIPAPAGKEFQDLVDAFNQMSHKLRLNMDQMESRVAERTQDLHASNAELKREIEERKKMERELRAREDRFHKLFEGASDGILILKPTGELVSANES